MLLRELTEQARLRGAERIAGYRERAVLWEVVLSPDGTHGTLRRLDGPRGQSMLVPDIQRSGIKPQPFPCADKAGLVFGLPKKSAAGSDGAAEAAKAKVAAAAFAETVAACAAATADPAVAVLERWLAAGRPGPSVEQLAEVDEPDRVCFRLDGQTDRLHELPAVAGWWAARTELAKSTTAGWCLVCGQSRPLADTFPQQLRSGSLGPDSAALISSNSPSFGRQSQEQLGASPICLSCAQASVAGLQSLLDTQGKKQGHRHAVRLNDDRRLVFWLPGSTDETALVDWLIDPDPAQVDRLLDAPRTASAGDTDLRGAQFVSVILGQNRTRVVVRDHHQTQLSTVEGHVAAWFTDSRTPPAFPDDMTAAGRTGYQSIPGIERSLTNPSVTTVVGRGWGEALWNAALFGTALPPQLLARAVERERTEGVTAHARNGKDRRDARRRSAARVALLTVLHTRANRPEDQNVTTTQTAPVTTPTPAGPADTALQLGRLFACLERIQSAALGFDLNAPLSARWLGRASTSPAAAYPSLLRNAPNHLNKLRKTKPGSAHALQSQLDRLTAAVPGFPTTLTLTEQGAWFLGLHRQRAEDAARAAEYRAAVPADQGGG